MMTTIKSDLESQTENYKVHVILRILIPDSSIREPEPNVQIYREPGPSIIFIPFVRSIFYRFLHPLHRLTSLRKP